ncbi:hypothetical protein ABZ464_00220 [Streptomyces sp. NPDC005820]|uniref:hypothetical protein n=1 Tax=Streptomyces sp. NPDC005820 TaxID=3157069 RepID=UPI0033C5C8E1
MRRVAYVLAGLAAAGAATYLVVYLYWWQWQRALICGVLLLVVEVMLLGVVLLGRLARIEERLRDTDRRQRELDARQEDVLARLRRPAAEREEARFSWLEDPADRTYVFVPVLMVTGVLLSGLAWVVQRVASATARPAERRLAGRLAVLAAPGPDARYDRDGHYGLDTRYDRDSRYDLDNGDDRDGRDGRDPDDLPLPGGPGPPVGVARAWPRSTSSASPCSPGWSWGSRGSRRPARRRRTGTRRPP